MVKTASKTRQKQTTDSVSRLIDRQDGLIKDIAHEVRTPIARLKYRLALLDNQESQYAEIHHDIDEIEQLIEELLFRAKVENVTADQNKFTVYPWLAERINQARIGMTTHLQWQVEVDGQLEMEADLVLLTRAIDNLLNNAKRFAKNKICVRAKEYDDYYYVSVEDDGIGIPSDQYAQIFEPFVRLDNSRARTTGGHGLGLSIVASIMRAHQGKVSVSDGSLNGALFTLQWPKNSELPIV